MGVRDRFFVMGWPNCWAPSADTRGRLSPQHLAQVKSVARSPESAGFATSLLSRHEWYRVLSSGRCLGLVDEGCICDPELEKDWELVLLPKARVEPAGEGQASLYSRPQKAPFAAAHRSRPYLGDGLCPACRLDPR